MDADVFLDFLNRDSREIFGLYSNATRQLHVAELERALNVAVLLCKNFCVVPAGFLAECEVAREAITHKSAFLKERLIRYAMREPTIAEYFDKKQRSYNATDLMRKRYRGLFDPRSESFLRRYPNAVVHRDVSITDALIERWEAGPDNDLFWKEFIRRVEPSDIERIRVVPRILQNRGVAATWSEISPVLIDQGIGVPPGARHLLQHDYFTIYVGAYAARTITSLPFSVQTFGLPYPDLCFDCEALKSSLQPLGTWELVANARAVDIVRLRVTHGWRKFVHLFKRMGRHCRDLNDFVDVFAYAASAERNQLYELRRYADAAVFVPGQASIELTDRLSDVLATSTDAASERFDARQCQKQTEPILKGKQPVMSPNRPIAFFCPLELERECLVKRLGLSPAGAYWRGNFGGRDILLFTAPAMGRVVAAVETMRLFRDVMPGLVVVAGIAGGFKASGVDLGHVLVADVIADLATRKWREQEKGILPEFRPRPFIADDRLVRFFHSGNFEKKSWQENACQDADWPNHLRPWIHTGPIACLDEVVGSDDWVQKLISAWPKLLGVEMESGGVYAVANNFNVPCCTVRGVSDLADPAKSDTEWRKRAIVTVSTFIEFALRKGILDV